ncbi:hypothetical protein Nepgr_011714 [Nepenthes gracilis]|uniref:Cytochrome P450 n=1 Tax=Nepenthes gracilis TaxID=150966 RepID=A0AAD3SEM6_NEPGR|nr:hypothetical protein Nepgr_011714 [Nepenthes gracilis]
MAEILHQTVALCSVLIVILTVAWRVVDWAWIRPKETERRLRRQGLRGNPYRPFIGDAKELIKITKEALSKPIDISDDVVPRIVPFLHHTVNKHGRDSFAWVGTRPWLILMDLESVKEVLTKYDEYQKPNDINPILRLLVQGLLAHEGEKWAKHRKVISPAFHMEKLKGMIPAMHLSCSEMLRKWEEMASVKGSVELDVLPFLENLTGDMISRAAFSSSYEEGRKIFHLLTEQTVLAMPFVQSVYIPGWRFLPTKTNRRMKGLSKEIEALLTGIIERRKRALEAGETKKDDLLGLLLESNQKEMAENGNNNETGLTIQEVVQECKLFYLAGQETTASLLVWTLVLLGKHQNWQESARREVLQAFGDNIPDFEGLKILYSPSFMLMRKVSKETRLKNLLIPPGTEIIVSPTLLHQDCQLWGNHAKEFKPERFSEGVYAATKGQISYIPFSWGPRICIGQNFALMEAKLAMTMILQRFSFHLSPAYVHAPYTVLSLKPQHGANMILYRL